MPQDVSLTSHRFPETAHTCQDRQINVEDEGERTRPEASLITILVFFMDL